MYSRQYKTAKSSAHNSDTPAKSHFASRRFLVQKPVIQTPQNPDVQAQSARVEQSGQGINPNIFKYHPPIPPRGIQMKLSIGEPGDKYEQEADRVAADVVQRINAPESEEVQRMDVPEEEGELQMKPAVDSIQRMDVPEEEELQMKPAVDSIQRMDVREEEEPEELEDIPIDQGLIHGTYKPSSNTADLHVRSGRGVQSLAITDMLRVAQELYRRMTERHQMQNAPVGTFILHPTGAAVVKILTQILGEALGNADMVQKAQTLYKWRKIKDKIPTFLRKKEKMDQDKIAKGVIPEHVAYIKALENVAGIEIRPILPSGTPEEFEQNMLEASKEGKDRMIKYIETLEQQEIGVSLNVTITHLQLPEIIRLLSTLSASA